MNILARPVSAIVLPAFATAFFLAAAHVAPADEPGGDQPVAEATPVTTTWDFVTTEGWSEYDDGLYSGETNVNGHTWFLTNCYVRPADEIADDSGYVYLYKPANSYAISPAFAGVVTQVTTVFRPSSAGSTRKATLYASTDGGATFTWVGDCPTPSRQTYTTNFSFSPGLDGGDYGVIFCASNSGTSGYIQFRRLTIEGTTTTPEEPDANPYSPFGASTAGQPQGALSGTVLYLSAGHGYTANDDTNDWTTANAPSCGMVEDFGNLDQLNFFALQAWKAGATIVPMRPLGYQTNEVVIDNVDTDSALSSRVTFGGAWANASQPPYYGKEGEVGYRWTYTCPTGTTAWASYRPDIPAAGEYPVYVWAGSGSDRVPQLYRVHHGGGVTDVRVDHRQVGNGWVWLGNYWFEAGTGGCVNVCNYAPDADPDSVTVADAVRFGNGMGDIERDAAGISGCPRELEGARYWIQGMVDGSQGLSTAIYDSAGTDRDDNTVAPNLMACAMCTNDVSPGSRLYLSFHSREGHSQRGCMGLHAPDGSTNLARCIADSIVTDMTLAHAHGIVEKAWEQECPPVGETSDAEIGGDLGQKMDAAIVEVAAHDIESDAAILKSLRGREWLARSALRGVIRHLAVPEVFPPDAPVALSAINSGTNTVTLSWEMPAGTNRLSSPHAGFVVYVSTNGYAFGNPIAISSSADSCSHTFADLPDGTTCFFRVCAVNEGGESLSSPVAGARLTDDGSTADILVVDGFRRVDASITPAPFYDRLCGADGNVALVRPKMINSFDYVKEHGNAIAKANKSFDFLDASRATSADLARYPWVVWCLGRESIVDETFSYGEQQLLSAFLDHHGALCVSSSDIGWDLYANGSAGDRAFFTNWLHCGYVDNDAGTGTIEYKSGTYFANTNDPFADFNYTNALTDTYAAASPDVLAACGDAFTAAFYGAADSEHAAIIACSNSTCRTVVMGFPFETIPDEANRNKLMGKILGFFTASSVGPSWSEANINENTGPGGIIEINLKSHLSGYPSPAITLWDASYDFCGNTDNPIDPATYDFTGEIFTFRAPTNATSALCIFSFRAGDNADLSVNITVGEAPVWRPIPEILLDLDTGATNNLREYVSGILPIDLSLDWEHTDAAPGGYVFDPSSGLLAIAPSSTPLTNVFTFTAANATATNSVTVTNVIRRLDTDDNGIPDWWEIQNFGGPTSCNPILDPDEDGYANYLEYLIDTDPHVPSALVLDARTDETNGTVVLSWHSATGTTFTVYASTNILGGTESFTDAVTNVTADSSSPTLSVSPTDPTTFYRLQAN